MLSPFWRIGAPGIVLIEPAQALGRHFWRFHGRPAKGTYNVENTPAETFNLE
ncbi:hypothetical protein [Pseudomonas sp. 18173]|uniref:hypothetical protein n=1 Tax=Pseudomonas sp. 18173 TaxID=3390055 RepID=UPI003D1C0EBC